MKSGLLLGTILGLLIMGLMSFTAAPQVDMAEEPHKTTNLIELELMQDYQCPCQQPVVQNCSGTYDCSGGAAFTATNNVPCGKGNCDQGTKCSWTWKLVIDWTACNTSITKVKVKKCGTSGWYESSRPALPATTSNIVGTCSADCSNAGNPVIKMEDSTGAETGRCNLFMDCPNCPAHDD